MMIINFKHKGSDFMEGKEQIYIFTGGLLTKAMLSSANLNQAVIIGVDRGAEWLMENGIIPDYFIGDFDSVSNTFLVSIRDKYADRINQYRSEKNETDTELAMRLAISLKPDKVFIYGAIGTRLDHVIANIHLLLKAEEEGIVSMIIGSNNRIQLLLPYRNKLIEKSEFNYVSLLPFSEEVNGIYLSGFKYPLHNATMKHGNPYGVSNEIIESNGSISIDEGILLIVESKD